jgi:hypothetical protein
MSFVATGEHMAITGMVPQLRTTDMASSIRFYTAMDEASVAPPISWLAGLTSARLKRPVMQDEP